MVKKAILIALAWMVLSITVSPGEEKEEKKEKVLEPGLEHRIVVTATRIETPVKEVASSITVITKEDLQRANKTFVLEVLEDIPGLSFIQNGGPGSASAVFLRGANSEHTLFLLDGVELNDPINPSRSYDLAHLPVENIERIEILRGPQSTLYGSDAIGGVVNIITRKGHGKPRMTLSSGGGSYGTISNNLGLRGGGENINYSLGLSHFLTRGFSAADAALPGNEEEDGYRNLAFSGRLGLSLKDNLDLDFLVQTVSSRTEIDNFGGPFGNDPNSIQDYTSVVLKGGIRTLRLNNRWEQKLGFSFVAAERRHDNPPDDLHPFDSEEGLFRSGKLKIDWQNNFFLHASHTLSLGLEAEEERGKSEYYFTGVWGTSSSLFPDKTARKAGIYLQDQVRLAGRFFATLGIRFDIHSEAGPALTYRLAPAYFIEETGTRFKATLGTGFKAPSLYQLYAPSTIWGPIGNENLQPETGTGWDLGVEQQFFGGKVNLEAACFSNRYRNLISFDFASGFINIGRSASRGIELSLNGRIAGDIDFRVTYTRMEAKDLDDNTPLLRRPSEKFTASLGGNLFKKSAFLLSLVHTGTRDDMDFSVWPASRVTLAGYTLLNASADYELSPLVRFYVRFDNILNEKYEMVRGYGTPGFSAYGGIKLSL